MGNGTEQSGSNALIVLKKREPKRFNVKILVVESLGKERNLSVQINKVVHLSVVKLIQDICSTSNISTNEELVLYSKEDDTMILHMNCIFED